MLKKNINSNTTNQIVINQFKNNNSEKLLDLPDEYTFLESTQSMCPLCMKPVSAKIVDYQGKVIIIKRCFKHGMQQALLEEDALWFRSRHLFDTPRKEIVCQTQYKNGCPFDCGLCPDHEQHTCIGLIEVTSLCNLGCPTCYAYSGAGEHLSLDQIKKMIDLYVKSESGNAEILQISGGEPTLHPKIIDIISMSREKVAYVMLNTNGIRISQDEKFVEQLSQFKGHFEIYLQFDGIDDEVCKKLRGKPLLDIKRKAIELLNKYDIPITLVVTVERNVNEDQLGYIVNFALSQPNIRGINFQPVTYFGRLDGKKINPMDRATMTGIMHRIEEQMNGMLTVKDFTPLPCNVHRAALCYCYRKGDSFKPISRSIDVKKLTPLIPDTFYVDGDKLASSCGSGCDCGVSKKDLFKFLPISYLTKSEKEKIGYVSDHVFRISITSFIDAYNFDLTSMRKECVHIFTTDMKKIPFSSYNMIHRTMPKKHPVTTNEFVQINKNKTVKRGL